MERPNANITLRKDGRFMGKFIVGYDDKGKAQYQYVYGRTYDEAESKVLIGQEVASRYLSGRYITVGKVYAEWLNAVVNRVKESTLANYKAKFEKHILPVFGDVPCVDLSARRLNEYINKKLADGLSASYARDTLQRLINNKDALDALMRIEEFRSLNQDIETIINKSEAVKNAKKEGTDKLTPKEKKELTDEEKEYKSLLKQIQEKLIKFATRVPVFMYLTDYRERSLKDVITQLEPGLFKKVTGLDVKDFELLCSIGVFNASLMNDAIFKFKRYEDASLVYTGIDKHESDEIGGWDTVIRREEYEKLFYNQQATMDAPESNESPEDTIAAAVTTTVPKQELVTAQYGIPTPDSKPKKPSAPARPEAESFDVSKVKVGVKVSHKLFGVGTVVKKYKSNKYVIVHFKEGEKQFLLPDAFTKGFLELV